MTEKTNSPNYFFGKVMDTADLGDGGKGDTASNYAEKNLDSVIEIVSDHGAVNSVKKMTMLSQICAVQETDANICHRVDQIYPAVKTRLIAILDEFNEVTKQVKSNSTSDDSVLTGEASIEQFREASKCGHSLSTVSSSDSVNASNVTLFRISHLSSSNNEEDSHEINSQVISETSNVMPYTNDGLLEVHKYLRQYGASVDLVVDEVTSSDVAESFPNLDFVECDSASLDDETVEEESDSQISLKQPVDWNCVNPDLGTDSECNFEHDIAEKLDDCRIAGDSPVTYEDLCITHGIDSILQTETGITTSSVENLSPEVLLLIFSYLSVQDLQQNVSRVCRKWSELSDRPCLRRKLRLHGSLPNTKDVCDLLPSYPNLCILEIEERNDLCEILCQVSVTNQRLCCLIIKRCWNPLQYDVVSDGVLEKLFKGCPRLSSVTVKKSPFSGFFEVFNPVKEYLGQIKRLNLNFVSGLESSEDVRLIAENCPHLEDFRALTRPACNAYLFYVVQDSDVRLLTSRLSARLKVLKLEGDALTDEGVELITCCLHLRKLCLRRVRNITDVGLLELTRLEELTALELVDVARPSAQGWKQLFRRCSWEQLHTLLLARCINIDDDALAWAAAACRKIKRFCIAGCYLTTSKGLKVMFRACPMIEELILCLSQTKGCIFWIPTWVPKVKKILYHSCYRLRSDENAKDEYLLVKKVFEKKHPNLEISYIECLNDLMVVS